MGVARQLVLAKTELNNPAQKVIKPELLGLQCPLIYDVYFIQRQIFSSVESVARDLHHILLPQEGLCSSFGVWQRDGTVA
ncbi:MAG: hypothetical protein MHM6MM_009392 [Cercozoa sp. M6MM]